MAKFKPTLAATIEQESQLQFPLLASPKLDGIRALGSAEGLRSRTLKPIPNQAIQSAWQAALSANASNAHLFHGFDGELTIAHDPRITPMGYQLADQIKARIAVLDLIRARSTVGQMPFDAHPFFLDLPAEYNDNQSAIMSQNPDPTKVYQNYPKVYQQYPTPTTGKQVYPDKFGIQIVYWVFDHYAHPQANYQYRYSRLEEALGQLKIKHSYGNFHIVRLPQVYIPNEAVLQAYEEACLSHGFEGVIVRKPDSPYKFGRSSVRQLYLGKIKRFKDDEARIIDFDEQLENANPATVDARGETERSHHQANMIPKNTLGKLICEHPKFGTISIGTGRGLTHSLRQEIWDNRDAYLGKMIKFKYFPIGMKYKPRLPIFLGFRDENDL
jgi:DNA ligase-1